MELEKRLFEYLQGLFEDDPLDDEIKHIYFLIVDENGLYHLEIKGSEIKNTQVFDYNPLESQYFFYDYPSDKSRFLIELELAIKNLPFFDGRKVYILSGGKLKFISQDT